MGEPHPWEPRHMKLRVMRLADSPCDPSGGSNLTLGIIRHLWRSPVPFLGFYPPEGVRVTGGRPYIPGSTRLADDAEYLAGVEEHKRAFALELRESMSPGGRLAGYYDVHAERGWGLLLDLPQQTLEISGGFEVSAAMPGDLAPFVWAYRRSGFCMITVYDRDLESVRDDLLFVAKYEGLDLRWGPTAA